MACRVCPPAQGLPRLLVSKGSAGSVRQTDHRESRILGTFCFIENSNGPRLAFADRTAYSSRAYKPLGFPPGREGWWRLLGGQLSICPMPHPHREVSSPPPPQHTPVPSALGPATSPGPGDPSGLLGTDVPSSA